jgi:hypothetical protein
MLGTVPSQPAQSLLSQVITDVCVGNTADDFTLIWKV